MLKPKPRLDKDARREAILDVAQEVFLEEGFAAASMSTIAARLGGSKGTLYNYFRSKEQLFDAFVRRTCARFADAMSMAPPIDADLRLHLVHLGRAFLDHLMTPDSIAVQRLVIGEGGRFPELGRIFYEAGPQIFMERMTEELTPLIEAGVLRRADPKLMGFHFKDLVLSGLYQPIIWGVRQHPTAAEKDAQAALGVDTFLRAYRPD